jgi:hypothetical protein
VARHLDPSSLSESVARYAGGQVDAGCFASIEDVLSAGVEARQRAREAMGGLGER